MYRKLLFIITAALIVGLGPANSASAQEPSAKTSTTIAGDIRPDTPGSIDVKCPEGKEDVILSQLTQEPSHRIALGYVIENDEFMIVDDDGNWIEATAYACVSTEVTHMEIAGPTNRVYVRQLPTMSWVIFGSVCVCSGIGIGLFIRRRSSTSSS